MTRWGRRRREGRALRAPQNTPPKHPATRHPAVAAAPPSFLRAPGALTTKSVALYWSPKAWRPTTMGRVQPGTRRGTFLATIGSRKTVPFRMLRMVPLGDFHICFSPNSLTRASSGVMVAHLMPTLCSCALDRGGVLVGCVLWVVGFVGFEGFEGAAPPAA